MKQTDELTPVQQSDIVQDVRQLMDLIGVSQKEIASVLGVPPSHINLYFKSKSDIHSMKLVLILQHLGIDIHQILQHKIDQMEGRRSSSTAVFYHKVRRLKKNSRDSILRLIEQLTT